jgi:hypothetical protein
VLFLFGLSLLRCSVFPDHAPAIGHSPGGSGGSKDAGNGGATAGSGGDAGSGAGTDAEASGGSGTGGASTTGGASGSGGAPGSGGNADAGDASRDATAPDAVTLLDGSTRTVAYVADVADCIEAVTQPQQGSCLSYSTLNDGPNELWVDVRRTGHRAFTTYLSFPIDGTIANHTVESVELRVTVTMYTNAPGTGADVWEVVPFDAQSLYFQTPATKGPVVAGTPGPALLRQTVTYSLPVSVAKPNIPLYLSLTLPPGGDGTGYWGKNGPATQAPPTLVVNYR